LLPATLQSEEWYGSQARHDTFDTEGDNSDMGMASVATFAIALCLMLVLPGLADAAREVNMLANPGFEEGGDMPSGWVVGTECWGTGEVVADARDSHSGKRCVRITPSKPGKWGLWSATRDIEAAPQCLGALYRICGWYWSPPGCNACPTVMFVNAAGERFDGFGVKLAAAGGWAFFDAAFRPADGTNRLTVELRADGIPGTVTYDDASVTLAAGRASCQEALARTLRGVASELRDWWCASLPGGGGVEFLLRNVCEADLLMRSEGRLDPGPNASAGAEVTFFRRGGAPTVVRQHLMQTNLTSEHVGNFAECEHIDLARIAPADWNGNVAVCLRANDLGNDCRMLAAVKLPRRLRSRLVGSRIVNAFESSGLPWNTEFLEETQLELRRLEERNYASHLRRLAGATRDNAGVVVLDATTKRRPDQWRDDLVKGTLEPTDQVQLLCAGGETESFQCLFVPPESRPGKLSAEMSELRSVAGSTIPADACKVHLVEYVPFQDQWWPDPLLCEQPFEPSKNGPPVFWVNVSVPAGQAPGVYQGKLHMRAERGGEGVAYIQVRVPAFSLPRENHLNTSFWVVRGRIAHYFNLPGPLPPAAFARYVDLAAEHRITLIDVTESDPMVDFYRESDGSLSYDWSRWDEYLRRLIEAGVTNIDVGMSGAVLSWFSDQRFGHRAVLPITAIDRATGEKVPIEEPFLQQ